VNDTVMRLLLTDSRALPYDVAWSRLDAGERATAERFVHDDDRERYVRAHGVLRACVGTDPLVRSPTGKPSIPGGPTFSFSHCGDLVAIAWSTSLPSVGVDVEPTDLALERAAAALVLSPEELQLAADGPPALARCWTRKEAFAKATGRGLTDDLTSVDLTAGLAPDGFVVETFEREGHVVSVAARGRWTIAWSA
jgi:4'-phosphopantetheinyl transferase